MKRRAEPFERIQVLHNDAKQRGDEARLCGDIALASAHVVYANLFAGIAERILKILNRFNGLRLKAPFYTGEMVSIC